jgi:cysteine synthase A
MKKRVLTTLFLLMIISQVANAQDKIVPAGYKGYSDYPMEVSAYYNNAVKFLKSNQYTNAIDEFRKALRENPADKSSKIQLVNAYILRAQYYNNTAKEILEQLDQKIDIFVSGIGSGGTLQGIASRILEKNPDCKIVAVEPKNVSALLGDEPGLHQIQGIGDGFVPEVLNTSIITDIVEVTDDDAINTARELAKVQGFLVGTSSGANVWAAKQMAKKYGKDKVIVTILADRAERYFSTALI